MCAADGARTGPGFARCIVMAHGGISFAAWYARGGLAARVACRTLGGAASCIAAAWRMLRICTIQAGTMRVVHCIGDVAAVRHASGGLFSRLAALCMWQVASRSLRGTLCMTHVVVVSAVRCAEHVAAAKHAALCTLQAESRCTLHRKCYKMHRARSALHYVCCNICNSCLSLCVNVSF